MYTHKYRVEGGKPVTAKAFLYEGPFTEYPSWFQHLINKGDVTVYTHLLLLMPKLLPPQRYGLPKGMPLQVFSGIYVLREMGKPYLTLLNKEEFLANYEETV